MEIPGRQKTLEVFLVFALAGLAGGLVCEKKWPGHDVCGVLLLTGALIVIGLCCKGLAAYLAGGWLFFGEVLGRLMSGLMLTVVFFVLLTPIAWLYRRFTKNPLQLKRLADASRSYYIKREQDYQAENLENLW